MVNLDLDPGPDWAGLLRYISSEIFIYSSVVIWTSSVTHLCKECLVIDTFILRDIIFR